MFKCHLWTSPTIFRVTYCLSLLRLLSASTELAPCSSVCLSYGVHFRPLKRSRFVHLCLGVEERSFPDRLWYAVASLFPSIPALRMPPPFIASLPAFSVSIRFHLSTYIHLASAASALSRVRDLLIAQPHRTAPPIVRVSPLWET